MTGWHYSLVQVPFIQIHIHTPVVRIQTGYKLLFNPLEYQSLTFYLDKSLDITINIAAFINPDPGNNDDRKALKIYVKGGFEGRFDVALKL